MHPADLLGSGGLLALRAATMVAAMAAIYLTLKLLWPRQPLNVRFEVVGVHRRLAGGQWPTSRGIQPPARHKRPSR